MGTDRTVLSSTDLSKWTLSHEMRMPDQKDYMGYFKW